MSQRQEFPKAPKQTQLVEKRMPLYIHSGNSNNQNVATTKGRFTVHYDPPLKVPDEAVSAEIGVESMDIPYVWPNLTGTNEFVFTVAGAYDGGDAAATYTWALAPGSWDIASFQEFLNINCEDTAKLPDTLFTLYESTATGKITIGLDHYMAAQAETGGIVNLTSVSFDWDNANMAGIAGLLGFNTDADDAVAIGTIVGGSASTLTANEGNLTLWAADTVHTFENAVTEVQLRTHISQGGRDSSGRVSDICARLDPRGQAPHGGHIHYMANDPVFHECSANQLNSVEFRLTDQDNNVLELRTTAADAQDWSATLVLRWWEPYALVSGESQLAGQGVGMY